MTDATAPGGAATAPFCSPQERRFVLVAAILASSLGFIDGSVVAIAIPAIRSDIGATLVDAQWIANGYALTLSALLLAGGAAGDTFGLRRTFIAGIALFVAASVACALAIGPATLIAARSVQGVGAAVMVPCSLAIIAKAYPRDQRGWAIGVWASSSALTSALGPTIGGAVLAAFDDSVWRVLFWVNVPLGGLALFLLVVKVPDDAPSRPRPIDVGGAALATAAFGAIAYGLTAMAESGAEAALPPGMVMALGGVLLAVFVFWEHRHRDPMVKLSLFRSKAFAGLNVATFLLYGALAGILFSLPMLLIAGWRASPAQTGLIFVPLSVLIAVLSGPVGALSDRFGRRMPIALGCLIVSAAFAGLAMTVAAGARSFFAGVLPWMVLMGLGMALVVSPLSTAVMMAVADRDTGAASGINNAVARLAGLVAVAAMGGVAAARYAASLGELAGVPGFGEPAGALSQEVEAARLAASDAAFASIAWIMAGASLLAALVAWLTVDGKAGSSPPA